MAWDNETIAGVWLKAEAVAADPSGRWRLDRCGAWMDWREYGNRKSLYGWEIDHVNPRGSDGLSNLQPLQWQNNVDKSDGRLKCNITAHGNQNVERN